MHPWFEQMWSCWPEQHCSYVALLMFAGQVPACCCRVAGLHHQQNCARRWARCLAAALACQTCTTLLRCWASCSPVSTGAPSLWLDCLDYMRLHSRQLSHASFVCAVYGILMTLCPCSTLSSCMPDSNERFLHVASRIVAGLCLLDGVCPTKRLASFVTTAGT